MKYFYTARATSLFFLSSTLTGAMIGVVTRSWLLGLSVFIPVMFADMFLRQYHPPFKGERRLREVHYWERIEWDGERWVDVDE